MLANFSTAEENYIKSIYHLQQSKGSVTTNELAAKLNTKPASVTDMLKKLKAKKLLEYEPYRDFQLSNEGKKIALSIIRRHRLWEFFLAEKLQFGWDEVHEMAEELEHISNHNLINKLDAFLSYPKFDPHGDPIPDKNGKMSVPQFIQLSAAPLNRLAEVMAIKIQSSELLNLLQHKNISIGTKLEVKRKFDFDNSFEIKIRHKPATNISTQLAEALLVKLL